MQTALNTMDTPTPIIEHLSQYWGYLATGAGTLVASYVFYHKYCRKRIKAVRVWCTNFIAAPSMIVAMREDMQFEGGLTFREWVKGIQDDMTGLRRVVEFETISRRALYESVDQPIFEADVNGDCQWVNKSYLQLAECSIDDVRGGNWRNMIAGYDREEVVDGYELAIKTHSDYKAKFRLATDNDEKWVRFSVICNKDRFGNVVGYAGKMWVIADPQQAGYGGKSI